MPSHSNKLRHIILTLRRMTPHKTLIGRGQLATKITDNSIGIYDNDKLTLVYITQELTCHIFTSVPSILGEVLFL